MKLLDKIAKKLGYVPVDSLPVTKIFRYETHVDTLCSEVMIPHDREVFYRTHPPYKEAVTKEIVHKLINELISHMKFEKRLDFATGNFIVTGTIKVADINGDD